MSTPIALNALPSYGWTVPTTLQCGLIYRSGYVYAKAGVCLLEISRRSLVQSQPGLFDQPSGLCDASRTELMQVVDHLNQRFGRYTLVAADALAQVESPWQMRQERKTPACTTRWEEIIEIWR